MNSTFVKISAWSLGLILVSLALLTPPEGLAQTRKPLTVTLDVQNEPVEAVLDEISNQLGRNITARDEVMGTLITVKLDKATPEEAVAAILNGHSWEAVVNQLTGDVTIWDKSSMSGEVAVTMDVAASEQAPVAEVDLSPPAQYQELVHSPEDAAALPGQAAPSPGPAVAPAPAVAPEPALATEPAQAPAPAQPPLPRAEWIANEWGERAMQPFQNAPFPHLSREDGWTYNEETFPKDPHYTDNTVGVFIPAGFKAGQDVNFIVHFHGWMNDVEGVFNQFGLDRQVAASGVNAVLLVVQGPKKARDSAGGRLEMDDGAFRALIDEAARFLMTEGKIPANARLGRIVLTAHSGGYRVTSFILKIGGLSEAVSDVLLFDASYGEFENFVDWAAAGQNRRLVSIFTNHLREANLEIMALLSRQNVRYSVMAVGDMSPDTLQARRPLFVFVPKSEEDDGLGHNDVVSARGFYELWLRTSALPLN